MKFFILFFSLNVFSNNFWKINPDHSEIMFEIPYLSFSKTTGRFSRFYGSVEFDEDQTLPKYIEIQISTESIYSGNKLRDNHLRAIEFFHVKKYPFIQFKSSEVNPIGPDRFSATGKLKIKDLIKEIKINFKMSETIKDTWNYENKFVDFKFEFDRIKHGLTWAKKSFDSKYLVGKIVKVFGKFQLQPSDKMTNKSKHLIPDTRQIRLRDQVKRGELKKSDVKGLQSDKPLLDKTSYQFENSINNNSYTIERSSKSKLWWISYIMIGVLGMLSLFYSSYQFLKNSNEISVLEYLVILPLSAIYALSMWYLAFGS